MNPFEINCTFYPSKLPAWFLSEASKEGTAEVSVCRTHQTGATAIDLPPNKHVLLFLKACFYLQLFITSAPGSRCLINTCLLPARSRASAPECVSDRHWKYSFIRVFLLFRPNCERSSQRCWSIPRAEGSPAGGRRAASRCGGLRTSRGPTYAAMSARKTRNRG